MPPVREIGCSDGIRVIGSDGRTVQFQAATIVALPGNLKLIDQRLNTLFQQQYESRFQLADYEPDHRVRQEPPTLHVWERIEGDELVVTTMWVAIHIYSLSPLKLIPKFQNKELGPITGEWW